MFVCFFWGLVPFLSTKKSDTVLYIFYTPQTYNTADQIINFMSLYTSACVLFIYLFRSQNGQEIKSLPFDGLI